MKFLKSYEEKMHLAGRIQEVIERYECSTTPKQRYKAESELCRLVDRISDGSTGFVQSIQNGDKRYIAHVRRDGGYRIPELQVIEGISPTQLSLVEYGRFFTEQSRLKEAHERLVEALAGGNTELFREYVDTIFSGDGRLVGVKKE